MSHQCRSIVIYDARHHRWLGKNVWSRFGWNLCSKLIQCVQFRCILIAMSLEFACESRRSAEKTHRTLFKSTENSHYRCTACMWSGSTESRLDSRVMRLGCLSTYVNGALRSTPSSPALLQTVNALVIMVILYYSDYWWRWWISVVTL